MKKNIHALLLLLCIYPLSLFADDNKAFRVGRDVHQPKLHWVTEGDLGKYAWLDNKKLIFKLYHPSQQVDKTNDSSLWLWEVDKTPDKIMENVAQFCAAEGKIRLETFGEPRQEWYGVPDHLQPVVSLGSGRWATLGPDFWQGFDVLQHAYTLSPFDCRWVASPLERPPFGGDSWLPLLPEDGLLGFDGVSQHLDALTHYAGDGSNPRSLGLPSGTKISFQCIQADLRRHRYLIAPCGAGRNGKATLWWFDPATVTTTRIQLPAAGKVIHLPVRDGIVQIEVMTPGYFALSGQNKTTFKRGGPGKIRLFSEDGQSSNVLYEGPVIRGGPVSADGCLLAFEEIRDELKFNEKQLGVIDVCHN